jgi:hypothetical protein
MSVIIMTACMGVSGVGHDACTSALEAGSKQSGVAKDLDSYEDKVSRKADNEARSLVGETGMSVGAVVGGVGKAVVDKSATLKFPLFLPSMYISTEIGVYKSMLGLEWKF